MNPQYMSYGGPQPGYQPVRPPPPGQMPGPTAGPPAPGAGFQNVPLGAGPPRPAFQPPAPNANQQFPPSVGYVRPPITISQLPPSQLPPTINGMQNGQSGDKQGSPKIVPPVSQGMPPLPQSQSQSFDGNVPISQLPPLRQEQNANMPPMQNINAKYIGANNNPPTNMNMANIPPPVSQMGSNIVTTPTIQSQRPPAMPENKPMQMPVGGGGGPNVPNSIGNSMVQGIQMPPMSPISMPGPNVQSPGPQMPPLMGQNLPPQGQPGQMPPPSGQMPPPSGQMGQMPPMAQANMNMPSLVGQTMPPQPHNLPPLAGQPQQQQQPQSMPPLPGQNMPPMPMGIPGQHPNSGMMQKRPPMPGQMPSGPGQMPPMPGQMPPMPGQMPPMPGQMPPGSGQMPPMPGQNFNSQQQFNQPPLPGQQYNPLNNQMQNMNISGPYPPKINGDSGPHMPPPLGQQQQPNYLNGQQQPPIQQQQQRPGYPPMPTQPMSPQYQQLSYAQQQQQQQQRRLNPDQMPSPIQVIQDDQTHRSGMFCANQKGLVPPLCSTKFVVQDQGYASPRFIRSTMYNVPITNDLMKQTAVPFGLVISPMARVAEGEYAPPIVNFGELGPVRCVRCKAYMCPYMQFIDSGRRFQCLFCKATTDVPAEYFQHLDHTGQRMDRYERPELVLGSYEFTATKEYCRNNTVPKPPAIIFIIDVSYNNVKSSLVALICSQMKDIIKNLPIDEGQTKSNMKVGFITYNSSVHFYNIKGNLAAPQMLVVGDTQEMFMPLLDGFLCTPEESDAVIDSLMEQIPQMFADTRECETILLPAIVAGMEALKASDCTGKLLVFHSSLPIAEAPGKLKARDDRKLLGTDKERTVLTPQNQVYNQLGQDCVGVGCSVDLFLFNNAYVDIATIGQVARLTGGEVYKYTYFQADLDGERLINDIVTNINRPIAFDSIMRVRTSTGVRATDFYGHCYMSNTTDMELASIDCNKALVIEVKHDDKLQEEEGIYIQVALLYTSVSGQRRLRVINQALKTCSQMADLYRSCDLETIITFFSKQAVYKIMDNNPKAVKDAIVQRSAQILANYRKNCASPSSAGQLILPECMKLLPLYVNCILKSDALSGGADMTIDDRSFVMMALMTMDIPNSVNYFYPRLIPLHEIQANGDELVQIPLQIRCTIEKMTDQGVYILENGIHMFLWIGLGANQQFVQDVFGVPSAVQVNIEQTTLPELNNPRAEAVRTIIEQIRSQRHRFMRLTLVRQKEKMESVFKHFLIEDRGLDGSPSYVDFLCHMHKEIRNILS